MDEMNKIIQEEIMKIFRGEVDLTTYEKKKLTENAKDEYLKSMGDIEKYIYANRIELDDPDNDLETKPIKFLTDNLTELKIITDEDTADKIQKCLCHVHNVNIYNETCIKLDELKTLYPKSANLIERYEENSRYVHKISLSEILGEFKGKFETLNEDIINIILMKDDRSVILKGIYSKIEENYFTLKSLEKEMEMRYRITRKNFDALLDEDDKSEIIQFVIENKNSKFRKIAKNKLNETNKKDWIKPIKKIDDVSGLNIEEICSFFLKQEMNDLRNLPNISKEFDKYYAL